MVRVCVILGELAERDPGGNWANRPANSLRTILLPWLPQTTASTSKRRVALKTLIREVPIVAWRLLLSLLPAQREISSVTHKPSWRNTIPDDWKEGVSQQEYWEQVSSYAELTVAMASDDMDKLKELIGQLDNLPQPALDRILEHLSSETVINKPEDQRPGLWTQLTMLTRKHRRFSDAKWALSGEIVSRIESITDKLAPQNPLARHRMLFSGHGRYLYEEMGDLQEQKLEEQRQQAIEKILADGAMDAIIQFVKDVEQPSCVGHSLGVIAGAEIDERILPVMLETDNRKIAEFTGGYVWSRRYSNGWEWVDGIDRSGWSVSQVGRFLSCLPFTEEAWRRATDWLGKSEGEYWSRANVNPYSDYCDLGKAIDKLIQSRRPKAAIDCLSKQVRDKQALDKDQAVKALLAVETSAESFGSSDAYDIIKIIKALQDDPETNPEDLFKVEWAYLPLLGRYFEDASPKTLENRLASDPTLFCEVIRCIYCSKKEVKPKKKPSEQDKTIADNAWKLLQEWRTPPGTQPDGTFLPDRFRQWLEQVKESCAESGHLEAALEHIGQVLFHCSPDSDGLWIHRAVADKLNDKSAAGMRDGYRTAVFNSRGAHLIEPTGEPERKLAIQYRQKAEDVENAGYQRFAATCKSVAKSYDCDAERIIAEHGEKE